MSGLGSGGPDDNDAQAGRLIAHTLRANERNTSQGPGNYVMSALKRTSGRSGASSYDPSDYVAAPLTKGSATGEGVNQPGRRQEDDVNVVAFHSTGGGEKGLSPTENLAPGTGTGRAGEVAFALRRDPGGVGQGHNTNFAADLGVRRLTPRECERLQGLPDDWTLIEPKTPDSRRYSGLGDAVTANVAEWIAGRL